MFRVGDEVVCVSHGSHPDWDMLVIGATYTVSRVYPPDAACPTWGIEVFEAPVEDTVSFDPDGSVWLDQGFEARHFRKVQKRKDTRNLTEWLSQPSGYDEEQSNPAPKAPAKKRERAS